MPVQSALALVGVKPQAAKGTLEAQPTFQHGVTDGNVLSFEIEQEPDEITSSQRVSPHAKRTKTKAGAGFTTRGFAKSVGAWLYGALGTKAVTGAGPYTHTIDGGTTLPRLSFWGSLDSNLYAVRDCMVDELVLSWEENEPLDVEVTLVGTVLSYPGSMTATVDDQRSSYLTPAGGTFKLDTDSATAVTARVKGGQISIKNNVDPIYLSGTIDADDVFPGRQEYEVTLTIVPEDLADFRTTVTGTSGGSTTSQTPVYGSFEVKFVDGTNNLTVTSLRIPFLCDFPDADPAGGPVELELVGMAVLPASGKAMTAVLINSQATY